MARKPIPAQGVVAPARSTASVIDTFTVARPDPDAGAKAERLAQSLGVLGQAVAPELRRRKAQQEEQDFEAGKAAYLTQTKADGKAIQNDEMLASQSAMFIKGFHEQKGRTQAYGVGQQVIAKMNELDDEARASMSAAQFSSWYDGTVKEIVGDIEGLNRDVLLGMGQGMYEVRQNTFAKQSAWYSDYLKDTSLVNLSDTASAYLSNLDLEIMTPEEVSERLQQELSILRSRGIKPKDAKKAIFNNINARAQATNNTSYYSLLKDKLVDGEIKNQIATNVAKIENRIFQEGERQYKIEQRRQKKEQNNLMETQIMPFILDEEDNVSNAPWFRAVSLEYPDLAEKAINLQNKISEDMLESDPAADEAYLARLKTVVTQYNLNPNAMSPTEFILQNIPSRAVMSEAYDIIQNSTAAAPYMSNESVGIQRSLLKGRYKSGGLFGDVDTASQIEAVNFFNNNLRSALAAAQAENGNQPLSPATVDQIAQQIGQDAFSNFPINSILDSGPDNPEPEEDEPKEQKKPRRRRRKNKNSDEETSNREVTLPSGVVVQY